MSDAADLLLTGGEIHTLTDPDEVYESVAVRDGAIVRLGDDYETAFLRGVETRVVDLGGRVLLPGFVDAHTHLAEVGRRVVHADLGGAADAADCLARLRDRASETAPDEWVLGFGYDESGWDDPRYLTRADLDSVSESAPVVAFREDMHVASLNGVALDRVREDLPASDVRTAGGDPTGVVVESAVEAVYEAVEPGREGATALLRAAQERANERGVTAVHDMIRSAARFRAYRDLDAAGELTVRARLNYWSDFLDAVERAGLRTNHGTEMVEVGAIKTYTDGSFGGRTARLSAPYADAEDEAGQWVVPPADLDELVARVDDADLQMTAHAIGDVAVEAVLDAYADCDDPAAARHRVEHAELADDDAIETFADLGVVASVQPNFLKWAEAGGLYDARLGDRRTATNRYRDLLDAGVHLAFGSDCMPLDPLFGVHCAVNHPVADQRLTVTEALRAYTLGGAYAGFDEDRLGTLEPGKRADFVALSASPWETPDAVDDLTVELTVVDGDVVYDGR